MLGDMTTQPRPCSVARTLEVVGAKWTLLAVREMLLGKHRFDEIVRHTARRETSSPRDCAAWRPKDWSLACSTKSGPRDSSTTSPTSGSHSPIVATMREFGDRHLAGESGPPMRFEHTCGEEYHAVVACKACGQVVGRGEITRIDPVTTRVDIVLRRS